MIVKQQLEYLECLNVSLLADTSARSCCEKEIDLSVVFFLAKPQDDLYLILSIQGVLTNAWY